MAGIEWRVGDSGREKSVMDGFDVRRGVVRGT